MQQQLSYQGAKRQSTRTVQAHASQMRLAKSFATPIMARISRADPAFTRGAASRNGRFPCGAVHAPPIDAHAGRRTPGGGAFYFEPRRGGQPKYGDTIIAARLSRRPKRSRTHAATRLAPFPPARLCPVSSVPRGSFNDTIRAPLSALRPPAADPRPCGQKRRPRALWRGGRRRAETRRLFVCRRGEQRLVAGAACRVRVTSSPKDG